METNKVKIYYDANSGYLCNRYPKDIKVTDTTPFIEVTEEEAEQTYSVEEGKFWAVKDGKLQKVDDVELLNDPEYQIREMNQKIEADKAYLTATDYVVLKISEAQLEGNQELVAELMNLYKDVLDKREQARNEINSVQAQQISLMSNNDESKTTSNSSPMLSIR